MKNRLEAAIGAALGARVQGSRPLSGGDINEAWAVRLQDGRRIFVKSNRRADPRMFECEARGLNWLAEAKALRTPTVLAVGKKRDALFLALEFSGTGGAL